MKGELNDVADYTFKKKLEKRELYDLETDPYKINYFGYKPEY